MMVRRARGFVPDPIELEEELDEPVLAVGGDLKAAVCLAAGRRAVLSEHLGDLEHPAALRHFMAAIERLQNLLRLRPRVIACDRHPAYHGARFARGLGLPVEVVQHHHAHAVSVAAEHGLDGPFLAVIGDGTGYGEDGTIWGGEILVCHQAVFERVGHLRPFPLPGGDAAAAETWRPALGALSAAGVADPLALLRAVAPGVNGTAPDLIATRLAAGRGAVACSSLGRLFDAAAAVTGIAASNRYEGEAAIALEAAAHAATDDDMLPAPVFQADGRRQVDGPALIAGLARRRQAGAAAPVLARCFHRSIAAALAAAAVECAAAATVTRVVLSGGCLVNRLLRRWLCADLTAAGLTVYEHRVLPPGDGCLALGQAVIAARRRR